MPRSELKVPGGKLIRVMLSVQEGGIKKIMITGDFFLHPEETIEEIEKQLVGTPPDKELVQQVIDSVLLRRKAELLGAKSADLAEAIVSAASAG